MKWVQSFLLYSLSVTMLLLPTVAFGTARITNLNGVLTDGQTVTVLGENFGVKNPVAPLLWDNVEGGAVSNQWTDFDPAISVYTGSKNLPGSDYCYRMDKSIQSSFRMLKRYQIDSQLYVFVKRNYAYDMTHDNHKFFRIWQSDIKSGYVKNSLGWNYNDGYDNPKYQMRDGEVTFVNPDNSIPAHYILLPMEDWPQVDKWQTDEFFVQLETGIGKYDGWMGYRLNNNQHRSMANNRGMFDENHNFPYTDIYIDNFAHDHPLGNGPDYLYVDDIYIDNTWARVVIGDNANYDQCGHIEIQPPVEWSDGTIKITLNQGSFVSLEGKYIFIIDKNNIPSAGFMIGNSGLLPPQPVQDFKTQ